MAPSGPILRDKGPGLQLPAGAATGHGRAPPPAQPEAGSPRPARPQALPRPPPGRFAPPNPRQVRPAQPLPLAPLLQPFWEAPVRAGRPRSSPGPWPLLPADLTQTESHSNCVIVCPASNTSGRGRRTARASCPTPSAALAQSQISEGGGRKEGGGRTADAPHTSEGGCAGGGPPEETREQASFERPGEWGGAGPEGAVGLGTKGSVCRVGPCTCPRPRQHLRPPRGPRPTAHGLTSSGWLRRPSAGHRAGHPSPWRVEC